MGIKKVPLHLVPPVAVAHCAMAFADGATKYGPYNWREKTVSSSIYISAAKRHLDAWFDGEECSRDANVHHLGHVMACMAILIDAQSIGRLNDDRPLPGGMADLIAGLEIVDKVDSHEALTFHELEEFKPPSRLERSAAEYRASLSPSAQRGIEGCEACE